MIKKFPTKTIQNKHSIIFSYGKYRPRLKINGKTYYLGKFTTLREAQEVRDDFLMKQSPNYWFYLILPERYTKPEKFYCQYCLKLLPLTKLRTYGKYKKLKCQVCRKKQNKESHKKRKSAGSDVSTYVSGSYDKYMKYLFRITKYRAKNTKNLEFHLTLSQCTDILKKQNYICPLSGLVLSHQINNPNSMSFDRINPLEGYTRDNIRFVTHWANIMRSTHSDKALYELCCSVVNPSSESYKFIVEFSEKKSNQVWEATGEAYFKSLISNCKRHKKVKEISITHKDLMAMFQSQEGKCAITHKPLLNLPRSAYSTSVDRIDSSKGYTLDNIQLTTKTVNIAKNKHSFEEFYKYCNFIINHLKE